MYVCAHTVRNTETNLLIEAKLLINLGNIRQCLELALPPVKSSISLLVQHYLHFCKIRIICITIHFFTISCTIAFKLCRMR